jgi:hypothetical protein
MKKHGLWVVQRALREHREQFGGAWWLMDFEYLRKHLNAACGPSIRIIDKNDMALACARRYCEIHKIETFGEYDDVLNAIRLRMNMRRRQETTLRILKIRFMENEDRLDWFYIWGQERQISLLENLQAQYVHLEPWRASEKFCNYTDYVPRIKKDGKPGIKCDTVYVKYSPIYTCDVCGKTGGHHSVRRRDAIYGWNFEKDQWRYDPVKSKSTLCTGCWNKARAVVRRRDEAEALQYSIKQLKKEIRNASKQANQNHG